MELSSRFTRPFHGHLQQGDLLNSCPDTAMRAVLAAWHYLLEAREQGRSYREVIDRRNFEIGSLREFG